jgi:hypothetical protein
MTRRRHKADAAPAAAQSAASEPEANSMVVASGSLSPHRPDSKLGIVLSLLQAAEGASLARLSAVTDWQPHTIRAALTGLRKRGFLITSQKVTEADGAIGSVYRIMAEPAR